MKVIKATSVLFVVFLLASCGGSKRFEKSPVDNIIRDMPSDRVFSVILNDMDVEGSFFHTYTHQYKIIEETEPGKPEERLTDWYEVSEGYFESHANDMGMEIASRGEDGKLQKGASPPGYNNYVGNPKYGRWENRGGSSFWAFYGQYAFMSSMFNMMTYPVRRSYWNDYRGSYYGTGRSYYGPTASGRSYYGTNSDYNRSTRPNSTWSRNTSSFKNRVSSRTSRSSSRYGGSSSRSRGGGYGK
ncbi:MAG: hypothetical protein AAF149_10645 [Bacteroidota bacterium]